MEMRVCFYGRQDRKSTQKFKYIESDVPDAQSWNDFSLGGLWGGYDKIAWSRAHVPIPPNSQGDLPIAYGWAEVNTDHILLETIKKAEDENAWIVRVYECKQYRNNTATITFGQPLRKAVECNLLEEDETSLDFQGHQLTFAIKPFEIKTFKIWF